MTITDFQYVHLRRKCYEGGAVFVPVCIKCARFVKADEVIRTNGYGGLIKQPNATCSKCGRTEMLFEGFFAEDEDDG